MISRWYLFISTISNKLFRTLNEVEAATMRDGIIKGVLNSFQFDKESKVITLQAHETMEDLMNEELYQQRFAANFD